MVKNIYFTLIFAFSLSNSFSQSGRSLLEVKKKRFQKKIELASKILRQTKEQKKSTVEDIKNFDLEINIQEQKMQLSNEEMSVIEKEMVIINQNVANQDAKLSQLRKQYAKILFENSKRNTNLSKLGFLLSAQDFNTFFMRYKYLKQFSASYKSVSEKLSSSLSLLEQQKQKLTLKKARKKCNSGSIGQKISPN